MNVSINAVIHGQSKNVKIKVNGGENPRELEFQAGQTFNLIIEDGETVEITAFEEEQKDETIVPIGE